MNIKTAILFVLLFCCDACIAQSEQEYQKAVKTYLFDKRIIVEKEIEWSKTDSLFSPFNMQLSYEFLLTMRTRDVDDLRYDISIETDAMKKQKLQDSLYAIQAKITELNRAISTLNNMDDFKPNRLGTEFKFSSKGKDYDLIFVFNNDGQTIGHVLSKEKEVIDISKLIPKQF